MAHFSDPSRRPRVVVVGAGFGGLAAVRALAAEPVDILLVDRHNYHTFTPLLYQVASALLDPSEIAQPVRRIVRHIRKCDVRLAEVSAVDLRRRVLQTDTGEITYDYLVLAAGSITNHFGIEGLEEGAHGLKALPEAMALRNHVLAAFERASATIDPAERQALLTFVVVGGGPTGVEYSGALSELVRHALARDFRRLDISAARVILVEATDHLLGQFHPDLRRDAGRRLRGLGVEVRTGTTVARVEGDRLHLAGGETIASATIVWTAGVRANPLAGRLGGESGRSGTVKVARTLQLPGSPEVFVVGDMAGLTQDGGPLPMLIPVAMQGGRQAAANIGRLVRGREPEPFHYRDPGMMATIGRNAGIAQIGFLRVGGFTGWLLWLGFHLLQVISLRAKTVVFFNWAWNYLFWDRPIRLLVTAGDRDEPR